MNESAAKDWMQRLDGQTSAATLPPFTQVEAAARLQEAFEAGRQAEARLDWIDAAWQSIALSALAALTVWLGDWMAS